MKLRIWILAALTGAILFVVNAQAHHSITTFYDREKTISISGVLKEVRILNPHSSFLVEVTETSGQTVTWNVVCGNATQMARAGWTSETLKVGTKITVEGNPGRNGARGLIAKEFTTADGRKLSPGKVD